MCIATKTDYIKREYKRKGTLKKVPYLNFRINNSLNITHKINHANRKEIVIYLIIHAYQQQKQIQQKAPQQRQLQLMLS